MKRILFVLLVLGAAMSSQAQHTLQLDDGAGRIGILQSNPAWPIGTTLFQLPPTAGTLVVAPPPGTPALMWLTSAIGNTLTNAGGGSTDPVERFGSDNTYDVVMMADGLEKMRMVAGGGVKFLNAAFSINNLNYNWPAAHGAGSRLLTNDGAGNLTWTAGFVTSIRGTANQVLANGTSGVDQTGLVILSTPQNIDATASPTFVGATLTGLTASRNVRTTAGSALTTGPIVLNGGATEVSGTLPIANGGTNSSTALVNGRVMTSVGGAIVENAVGTAAQLLHGDLSWGAVALGTQVSGVLPIANGGTNSGAALNNNRIMVSSGGAIVEAAALTNGQLLIGSTGLAPVAATLTGTANRVTVAVGAGTITLSGPQDLAAASSPSFTGLTVSGLTANSNVRTGVGGVLTVGPIALGGGATEVTGVLPIANGGTNSGTALNNNRIMVSSGGAIVEAAALTNGQLLIGSTGLAPVAATLTGTANRVTVAVGAGTITLSGPQDLAAASSPSFTGLTVSGLTANSNVRTGVGGVLTVGPIALGGGATEVTGILPDANIASTISRDNEAPAAGDVSGSLSAGYLVNSVQAGAAASIAAAINGSAQLIDANNLESTVVLETESPVGGDVSGTFATGLIVNNVQSGVVDLATDVTGILPAGNGGTGFDGSLAGNGTLAIGNGAGFTLANITGTANQVTVTDGAGTITLSGPQDLAPASSPTFVDVTLTGVTAGRLAYFDGSGSLQTLGPAITGASLASVSSFGSVLGGQLNVANGGTGVDGSTVTDGQLLIGHDANNNFSVATLTAGSGISITNGAGSITIAATGGGASAPDVAIVSADQTVAETTTLANSTNLTFTLAASTDYWIDGFLLMHTNGDNACELQTAFNYTGSLAAGGMTITGLPAGGRGGNNENSWAPLVWTALATGLETDVDQNKQVLIHVTGHIHTNAGGTFTFQFAIFNENAGTDEAILDAGSSLKVTSY